MRFSTPVTFLLLLITQLTRGTALLEFLVNVCSFAVALLSGCLMQGDVNFLM